MSIYWIILILVIALGWILPQRGPQKSIYITAMFFLHAFVCGCKNPHLTGDLMKYHNEYANVLSKRSLISILTSSNMRNILWTIINKLIGLISGYDYQIFLIILAVIAEYCVARFIYKFSPMPWFSYLVWNCMSFYTYGFSALKQSLAMALLLLAVEGVLEDNKKKFYIWVIIAGLIHAPAFAFLPVYFLSHNTINYSTLFAYFVAGIVVFVFRAPMVTFISDIYYDERVATGLISSQSAEIGGRFFLILMMLGAGIFINGLRNEAFKRLFVIASIAALFQMYSIFDNIFTRYSDYFLQIIIVYIPMLIYEGDFRVLGNNNSTVNAILSDDGSISTLITAFLFVSFIWYYYVTNLGVEVAKDAYDILNYNFFWNV